MDSKFVNFVLVIVAINIIKAKCSQSKWCYEKCLSSSAPRNPNNNIDIYFEYKKAVIKVPAPPKIKTNRYVTLSNGEILPEVSMRDFRVDFSEERCNRNKLNKTRKKIDCKPRPIIIDVYSTEGKVIPNKVLTKRCDGYCTGKKMCAASKSKNISTSVQVLLENGRTMCSTILVPKDTKCICQCAITEKSCTTNQKFNTERCSCECNNIKEKSHCEQKIERYSNKHFWDSKTCTCSCLNDGFCTTGQVWDKTLCGCTKKTDNG